MNQLLTIEKLQLEYGRGVSIQSGFVSDVSDGSRVDSPGDSDDPHLAAEAQGQPPAVGGHGHGRHVAKVFGNHHRVGAGLAAFDLLSVTGHNEGERV